MKLPQEDQSQSNQFPFLQDSSLLTQMPPEQHTQKPPIVLSKADQKIDSPTKPVLAQLDSQGGIRINVTIPASALTLVKLLGEGAYGSVYEGVWNEQPVAIKRLKAQHLTEKAFEELRQEAQIMFQLGVESKYIVPLKKICLEAPHYSLVMELMPKGSLYQLLHNGQPLPWPIRFQIALDTAWGLKDLHGYSILHRDLKSLNILLDDRLRAKLADFGLAKVKQETSSQSTIAKGTVLWMAPELFKRKAEVTAAADIWSMGMVLWELAAREIPFKDAQNQLQAMGWIEKGEKEEIPVDCPAELKLIIESCWDLTPTNRPTAVQVVERLKPLVTSDEKQKTSQLLPSLVKEPPKPSTTADSKNEKMKEIKVNAPIPKLPDWDNLSPEVRASLLMPMKEELEHRPVGEPKDKLPLTPPKKEQELKKLTPLLPLSESSQTFLPAPKPTLKPLDQKSLSQLQQLLQYVAEGEQDKAEALIQTNRNLLLYAGTVKDLSGREFKSITPFQYALWAMDWHMWKMIQKYLPEEQQREQFEVLETKGTRHGKHFSLQPLIGALQTYVDNYDSLSWKMFESKREHHWQKVVGGAQRKLPVHVINEYCRPDRSFDPCPKFTEASLPRSRKCNEGDWFTVSYDGGVLGVKFGITRDFFSEAGRMSSYWSGACSHADRDKAALQSLSKTRTQQLELLASQLKMSSFRLGA